MKKIVLLMLIISFYGKLSYSQKRGLINNEKPISLELLGTHSSGIFAAGGAEIGAYDPDSNQLFVTNAEEETLDIIDISDPAFPFLVKKVILGGAPNSVDVFEGLVAVAVEADPKQNPGKVQFYDIHGIFLKEVEVGALPDMLTFTKNGRYLLVANEGEPNNDYSNDPEGSVSIIDMQSFDVKTASFTDYNSMKENLKQKGIRIFGPNATVAQDFEPEYITTSTNSKYAWVTLQENNAIAMIDIIEAKVKEVMPLGFKDYSQANNSIDASDRDGVINIKTWPVKGMYLPDAIASYSFMGKEYLVTANEGDSRDYSSATSEETRIGSVTLDPTVFPTAADLKRNQNLGRLKITKTMGDTDGDGDYDVLYSFGARSFSIWSEDGQLVFDSGNDLEKITAQLSPANFNSDNAANGSFDSRSDDKGPEPEGLAIGKVKGRTYAFIGLERIGGIMVYDISLPQNPRFIQYVNNRDFSGVASAGTARDLGPEGVLFISEETSPVGSPLLVVTNEISGTTSIYKIDSNTEEVESSEEFSVKAFPNPVLSGLTLTLDKIMTESTTIEFTGLLSGKTYPVTSKDFNLEGKSLDIDVSHLPAGMYVMQVVNGNSIYRMNVIKK